MYNSKSHGATQTATLNLTIIKFMPYQQSNSFLGNFFLFFLVCVLFCYLIWDDQYTLSDGNDVHLLSACDVDCVGGGIPMTDHKCKSSSSSRGSGVHSNNSSISGRSMKRNEKCENSSFI